MEVGLPQNVDPCLLLMALRHHSRFTANVSSARQVPPLLVRGLCGFSLDSFPWLLLSVAVASLSPFCPPISPQVKQPSRHTRWGASPCGLAARDSAASSPVLHCKQDRCHWAGHLPSVPSHAAVQGGVAPAWWGSWPQSHPSARPVLGLPAAVLAEAGEEAVAHGVSVGNILSPIATTCLRQSTPEPQDVACHGGQPSYRPLQPWDTV